jgi:uncharacterized protein
MTSKMPDQLFPTVATLTPAFALAAMLAMPVSLAAQASPVAGSWWGNLSVQGTELPLVFHITETDGRLAATMDSPAQGARGIPVDSVRFEDSVLTLRILPIAGTYTGRLVSADEMEGEWRQGPGALPLNLRRGAPDAAEPRRPQHPEPPFPYRVEEVRFPNQAAGIMLAGTLTLPQGPGPFLAVALVTGSGPQDRDETIMGHKPFLVIADHLTRAGIAVLRYDDRGVGGSQGDFAAATSRDFAGDAAAAAAFLAARPEVDRQRIGLIGHSEGGLIAPLVATGWGGYPSADLAFIVLLAGPALPGDEILRLQADLIIRGGGATPRQAEQALASQARTLEVIRTEPDETRRRQRLREVLLAGLAEMTAEERAGQGIMAGQEAAWVDAQVAQVGTSWFYEFVRLDPRPALRQVRVPTLALFGELDMQVPPRQNEAEMLQALRAAPVSDFSVMTLPRLNHLFQTASTGMPSEYGAIEETFAPAALQAMTGWMLERFGARVVK